jgi:hypothetical protein
MNDFVPALKDRAILLGWVAGLVLISLVLWSVSYPFRAVSLMRSTNRVLISMDDERRLAFPVARPPAGIAPLGCWYRVLNSNSNFYVFAIMRDGILVPCGAEVTERGEVHIVPLGSHARQIMGRIPQSVIQVYVHRIESAAASLAAAGGGETR